MAGTKGTVVVDLVKFLRSRRDRAAANLPSHLQPYLEKRISVSEWYPEQEVFELMGGVVRLMPEPGDAGWYALGVRYARSHMEGSYGHLLGELRVETLPIRLSALWKTLHDTGDLVFRPEGAGGGSATVRGYESPGREMCLVVGAYLAETVGRAGIDRVKVEHGDCVHRGADCCTWRLEGTPRA